MLVTKQKKKAIYIQSLVGDNNNFQLTFKLILIQYF